jgi:hypothetical protein
MKNLIQKLRAIFFSSILLILSSNSCFQSDPPSRCDWKQELDSYMNSYYTFINNPTSSTCQNLKTQSLKMIEKFEDCADFVIYRDELRSTWNSINCSAAF